MGKIIARVRARQAEQDGKWWLRLPEATPEYWAKLEKEQRRNAWLFPLLMLAFFAFCLSLPSWAGQRSAAEVLAFKRMTPCPATGKPELRCENHQVDHIEPICAGGADHRSNMQYLTIQEHRWKTRTDVRVCRQLRKESAKQRSE